MNTLFALVMVVGTLLAILALVAFFVVRIKALAWHVHPRAADARLGDAVAG